MFDDAGGAQQRLMPGVEGREPVVAVEFGYCTDHAVVAVHAIFQTCH